MKIINFVHPSSPEEKKSCTIWFVVSCLTIFLIVAYIGYLQICAFLHISNLKNEYKRLSNGDLHYAQCDHEMKKLSVDQELLKKKLDLATHNNELYKKRVAQLNALSKVMDEQVHITNCSITEQDTSILFETTSITHAQHFIQALNASKQFGNLVIHTIHRAKKSLHITLKAITKTKAS